MVRLICQMLGLIALLLAPVPALAAVPGEQPVVAAAAAEAGHCDGTEAAPQDEQRQEPADKHPCCKDGMKGCCVVPTAIGGSTASAFVPTPASVHGSAAEHDLAEALPARPTEPPILA